MTRRIGSVSKCEIITTVRVLREFLEEIQLQVEILKKAYALTFDKTPFVDQRLQPVETPYIRLFGNLLLSPFGRLASENAMRLTINSSNDFLSMESADDSMALAEPRAINLDILFPTYNLNSVSEEHLKLLGSTEFDTLSFIDIIPDETQREHYMWLIVMHMYIKLGLVEQFKIPEDNLFRSLRLDL
eukprot:TRINITY_DN449_c0_g1_i1.p1 TRINITY_DN449_c0_g1~~TRINITY_DN449_c0_g1_i1.p1  ORF type:complete len:187 (-),score=29.67 TRINITY_DN449_c0_g1_i1:314-874(-)